MDTTTDAQQERMIRTVIDIPESLYLRGKRYFKSDKYKGFFTLQAFETRINYLEGRDKKLQAERIQADTAYIQRLIDTGHLYIK